MKHISTLLLLLVAVVTPSAKAQVCNYMPFKQNSKFTYTMYDGKDKPAGTLTYNVAEAKNDGNDMFANVDVDIRDEKGKSVSQSKVKYHCSAGKFYAEMSPAAAQM